MIVYSLLKLFFWSRELVILNFHRILLLLIKRKFLGNSSSFNECYFFLHVFIVNFSSCNLYVIYLWQEKFEQSHRIHSNIIWMYFQSSYLRDLLRVERSFFRSIFKVLNVPHLCDYIPHFCGYEATACPSGWIGLSDVVSLLVLDLINVSLLIVKIK